MAQHQMVVLGLYLFRYHSFLPSGQIIAFLFFVALIFAGITSAVSMLEPLNTWLIDRFCFSRTKANILTISVAYGVGVLLLLSNTASYQ